MMNDLSQDMDMEVVQPDTDITSYDDDTNDDNDDDEAMISLDHVSSSRGDFPSGHEGGPSENSVLPSNHSVNTVRLSSSSSSSSSSSATSAPWRGHGVIGSSIRPEGKKRVSWDRIHTREFALTVGDHPSCQDGLPVSLDWHHTDNAELERKITGDEPLSERRTTYTFPRRLSYEERKQRLCLVSGMTVDQVKNDEIDLVLRTLKEAWDTIGDGVSTTPLVDPTPLGDDGMDVMMQLWDDLISVDIDLVDLGIPDGDMSDFEWTD